MPPEGLSAPVNLPYWLATGAQPNGKRLGAYMIHLVTAANAGAYSRELDEMFQMRHRVFVEKWGWPLNSENGRERDSFDTDSTHYILITEADGSVSAAARLLPTEQPFLLSTVHAHMVDGPPPRGPDIWETSRLVVRGDRTDSSYLGPLFLGIAQFALLRGIKAFLCNVDDEFADVLHAIGLEAARLGPVRPDPGGRPRVAISIPFNEDVLRILQSMTGAKSSALLGEAPEV